MISNNIIYIIAYTIEQPSSDGSSTSLYILTDPPTSTENLPIPTCTPTTPPLHLHQLNSPLSPLQHAEHTPSAPPATSMTN